MLLLLVFKQTNITNTILFVISLDRQKKKERVLIGEELQIRFSLRGNTDANVLCDMTRPLGTFLAEFEHDPDGNGAAWGLCHSGKPCTPTAGNSLRWKNPPGSSWQKNISPGGFSLRKACGMHCAATNAGKRRRSKT